MDAIYDLIKASDTQEDNRSPSLFEYIVVNENAEYQIKEKVVNAAIALKCAMNLYKLEDA
jgi:hypothetical protein